VGADGLPKDIRIVRAVGLGLDERALDAVKTWRFEPGRKDGQPVPTQINVEVSFRLY
jgi:TonB family protein